MVVKRSEIIWHDATLMSPPKDGKYFIVWWDEVTMMDYTTDGGWNTHREPDGTVYSQYSLTGKYVELWADPPMIEEVAV